jgi:hypothetical protein
VVSASASTVKFWDTNVGENGEKEQDDESDSSEEEKPPKKRRMGKTGKNISRDKASSSTFFAEL